MGQQYIKGFGEFLNEEVRQDLPLESLEYDFWLQSRIKYGYDEWHGPGSRDKEFEKHCKAFKENIEHAAKSMGKTSEQIIEHLRKFWDKCVTVKGGDSNSDKARLKKFQNSKEIQAFYK